jgi:hypothetical protein
LEIGLNLQSGWNLGGPMVTPDKSAKVIAWSQFQVQGPANLAVTLPKPKLRENFYLEPDTVHGMKYLEAIRDVFRGGL